MRALPFYKMCGLIKILLLSGDAGKPATLNNCRPLLNLLPAFLAEQPSNHAVG